METIEERLEALEQKYKDALAEKEAKAEALEQEIRDLKAKQAKSDNDNDNASKAEHEAADYLLSKITVPDGSPIGATKESPKNANF